MDLLRRDRAAAPPQVCDADITAIIDAAVREIEFVLCGRGITLRKEIAPDLPPIECNKDQIRNLFMSLAINAVQSAPGGSVVVLTAHHGDGGVILDVKDQGQGSFVRQVANRFFGSRSRRAGIGLAAAYDIVRQHGGKIEAKADITKGLEFSVWLPLHRNCANGGWQGAGGGGR
jgi:signal transduction histidine kinase